MSNILDMITIINKNKKVDREFLKTNNKVLQELIPFGLCFHDAGLLRKDRTILNNAI